MQPSDTPPQQQTPHHYVLGHIALRQAALSNPYGFIAVMAAPQYQEFLDNLWRQVCLNCDEAGEATFDARDMEVNVLRVGEYPAVLIEMPRAHFAGEAHMICLVLQVTMQELAGQPENPEVRYFTLDKAAGVAGGEDKTMLCEWLGENHRNHGEGPEVEPVAFLESVAQTL